ncbi:MAG: ankyrin repeat domain-containing protein [Pseudomonadota bacterium]
MISKELIPFIRAGKEKEVMDLLDKGADPNVRGDWQFTALQFALIHGMKPAVIDKMLNNKADPMVRGDVLSFSPLDLLVGGDRRALISGHYHHNYSSGERVAIAKSLVRYGVDVNALQPDTGRPPLFSLFAAGGDLKLAEYLISQKAKGLNSKGALEKLTPLHLCAYRGQIDHVRFLIKYNVNPYSKDIFGLTPRLKTKAALQRGDVNPEKLSQVIEMLKSYEDEKPHKIKRIISRFSL